MSDLKTLDLQSLSAAVDAAVAVRARLKLQPAGGPGTKVFPPTYVADDNRSHHNTRYATEIRRIDGEDVPCVLLDSVASQANRMELALQDAWDDEELLFPLVSVDFTELDEQLSDKVGRVTTLEAPHRIYDAILRDSVDNTGALFRATDAGESVTHATVRNATALYRYCPTALIYGAWDSTGPKGGMGSKFQRAISSEIVGIGVTVGTKVGGRLDPLGIVKRAGPLKRVDGGGWEFPNKTPGKKEQLNPSDINHGNVAPSRDTEAGGVTLDYAQQTTVISLPALRRLRFKVAVDGEALANSRAAQRAARTTLAALALAGMVHAHAEGHDLRSGALLVGDGPLTLEVVEADGQISQGFTLSCQSAATLLRDAHAAAAALGMGWQRSPLPDLKPSDKLGQLLQKSQKLEGSKATRDGEEA